MTLYFLVHFSVFCPQHGEQITICLFVAMFYTLKYHLPHHLLFPKPGILLFILSRNDLEAPHASFSSSFFIAELPLSLPHLASAYALAGMSVSNIREMIPEQAQLPSCLVFPTRDVSWASDHFHCFGRSQIERYHF